MSILISGMDMPEDCASCDLSYYRDGYNGGYGCSQSGWRCRRLKHIIEEGEETRPLDCPFSEVHTPHGDLIDRNVLLAIMKKRLSGNPEIDYIIGLIERQRTIIEAEDGNECAE